MTHITSSRLAFHRLATGLALSATALLTTGAAQARHIRHHAHARHYARPAGGVFVDVRPLLAKGLGPYAERVRADLTDALRQDIGGLPPGERLVATIKGVSLTSWTGQMDGDFLGPNDYIDGIVTLIGADGRILTQQRITASSPAQSGGAWYVRGNEWRRTAALARVFAGWTRRYIAS